MKVAVGADHRGFALKELLKQELPKKHNVEFVDVGAFDTERSDYPVFATKVCEKMLAHDDIPRGILICGSGVGMGITANRFPSIYAVVAWDNDIARLSREHNNANILVLPSDFLTSEEALEMVDTWLKTDFMNGRYLQRIEMIDDITCR